MAKRDEHWAKQWRTAMAWQYMAVCIFDFILAPIFWSIIQVYGKGSVQAEWHPLTLEGSGFYHITMMAVLGVSAWSRGQEKMKSMGVDIGSSESS